MHAVFTGGLPSGAVVAAVVGVVAVDDHGEAAGASHFAQAAVQLVLAVVTTVGRVGAVLGIIEFRGVDHFVSEVEVARDRQRQLPVRVGVAGAVGGDGERLLPQGLRCGDGEVCAIDAAAERDQH